MLGWVSVEGPTGALFVGGDELAIRELVLPDQGRQLPAAAPPTALVEEAGAQIEAYLTGSRRAFDLPLRSEGTAFQEAVWACLDTIPYGEVRSYAWVADAIGRPTAFRAVGQALGANPFPILRCCHRVTATGGIGGYGGGLELKRALLALEGVALP